MIHKRNVTEWKRNSFPHHFRIHIYIGKSIIISISLSLCSFSVFAHVFQFNIISMVSLRYCRFNIYTYTQYIYAQHRGTYPDRIYYKQLFPEEKAFSTKSGIPIKVTTEKALFHYFLHSLCFRNESTFKAGRSKCTRFSFYYTCVFFYWRIFFFLFLFKEIITLLK